VRSAAPISALVPSKVATSHATPMARMPCSLATRAASASTRAASRAAEHEVHPLGREPLGDGEADAAARNDGDLARELQVQV